MKVICVKPIKLNKYLIVSGENCSAIYTKEETCVDIFVNGSKKGTISSFKFRDHFKTVD